MALSTRNSVRKQRASAQSDP